MTTKNIEDNIRKYLDKKNIKADKRLIIFLFFVVLSTIFWFLNQLEEEYLTEISLPVRYTDFPRDKILVNDLPKHFELRIRAHGYKLLEYKISNKFLPYSINVNSLTVRTHTRTGKFFAETRLLKNNIEDQISSELEIVSIQPDTLHFDFAERIFKKVPVVSDLNIEPATQFMIRENAKFTPDSILISGAQPIIDTINCVYTKRIDFKELKKNLEDEIDLKEINNVVYSEDEVDVNVSIEKFTEGSHKIKLNVINVPDSLIIRTFPKEITVKYFVALSDYEKVLPQLFEAVVDYNQTTGQENKLNIVIKNSPEYIKTLRYSPQLVEYIIEKK